MSKTKENLAASFAGESQANRKYLLFAEQADKEGYPAAAKLFRAAAAAEQIHAFSEFKAMGGVGTTAENLQAAIDGETFEFTKMYPPMIEDAKAEGEATAETAFKRACAAEEVHANLYSAELAGLAKGADADFYLCPICGYIHKGEVKDACPICKAKAEAFVKF